MRDVVLGLGANLGSRIATIEAALALLTGDGAIALVDRSPFFETEPVGPPQPWYVNAAARVRSALSLEDILDRALSVERALGRERPTLLERWGPRLIDIDLLWAGDDSIATDRLTVPHPRLGERPFALAPLLAVAPSAGEDLHAALRASGPAPGVIEPPDVRVGRACDEITVEATGGDAADALAFALRGIGSAHSAARRLDVATEELASDDEPAFVAALCRLVSCGLDPRQISLSLSPPVLRVIGCRGKPVMTLAPTEARADRSKAHVSLKVRAVRDEC